MVEIPTIIPMVEMEIETIQIINLLMMIITACICKSVCFQYLFKHKQFLFRLVVLRNLTLHLFYGVEIIAKYLLFVESSFCLRIKQIGYFSEGLVCFYYRYMY